MAIPEVVKPAGLADYLAIMSRAVFQAGLSWKMIEDRWDDYLRLFENFDPVRVAAMDSTDIERIMADGGVVRTYQKIAATIENARKLLELEKQPGGFEAYLGSFESYDALVGDLKKRFKFLGALGAYYLLFRTGHPVPTFEEWEKTIPGDHPRMREMIALAREGGKSPESINR
ncbi:MAG: DNA-3-methyladenine glycosylase I [Candidatus Eremiobacteraeota bacterium]|nr:DNA-3-methyladenine glycosylase I [Candidatus Eremiobacteraeota bacterium]